MLFNKKNKKNSVEKNDTIGDVINLDSSLAAVFAGFGMFCVGCPSAQAETVEEACAVHGIDADALVAELNKHLAAKEQA